MTATRYKLGGVALIGGPLLILGATAVDPGPRETGKEAFALITERSGQWELYTILGFFGFMLLVPAGIAAARLFRSTHPRAALAATIGIGVSGITIAGFFTFDMAFVGMAGGDPQQMAAFYDRAAESTVSMVLVPVAILSMLIGIPVLVWALWRSHVVHRIVPVAIALGFIQGFVMEDVRAINLAGDGLFFLGFAWLGWKVLTYQRHPDVEVRQMPGRVAA